MHSVLLPDDHDLCINLLLDRMTEAIPFREKNGVVHVGAHMGQEVPAYKARGFGPVLLIEANPEVADKLKEKFACENEVDVLYGAISNREGESEFIIHTTKKGGTESASLLRLADLGEIVPVFDSTRVYRVPTFTLDGLSRSRLLDNVLLLTVDVQGAELMVLQGARKFLQCVQAIICEVNVIEMYEGCALENEVDEFLSAMGFEKILAIYHELYGERGKFPAWGECLWIRSTD